ncbi:hypothetical protein DICVIV_13904 [Dictyocaulus viviparus]|uniref:Amidinotransferase n=1 Tax=Dictyocaulus viviparus TaxID=29172 RepID=A0A0D8XCH7_DICVI|nr:hypothetical protein DICVIV_13904 [Dictyocaulus viviparus]
MTIAQTPVKNAAKAAKRKSQCSMRDVKNTYIDCFRISLIVQLSYSINPWMDIRRSVDRVKAMEQWTTLKTTLENCGAHVEVMEAEGAELYPDMVFTANAAVVKGNRVYLANFAHPERKGERLEYGAGDALWGGSGDRVLFTGVGPRTDARALRDITEKLHDGSSWKVLGCRLVDPRYDFP